MATILQRLKRGVRAMGAPPDGDAYAAADRLVRCGHCAGGRFVAGRALLTSPLTSLFHLHWADRGAVTLTCVTCGRIEWFGASIEKLVDETP